MLLPCEDGWCLDDVPIVLGVNPDLSVVQDDYDGDTKAESVADELTDLVETRVRIEIDADGAVVSINRLEYVAVELPIALAKRDRAPRHPAERHGHKHER